MGAFTFHPVQPAQPVVPSWGPAPRRHDPNDRRWKQIVAFLTRNGAPGFEVRAVSMFPVPGFPVAPVKDYLIFAKTSGALLVTEDLWSEYGLAYASPDTLLAQLEEHFKFGNPNRIEEMFREAQELPPPTPVVSVFDPIGPEITPGSGRHFVTNGWNPGATSGDEWQAKDGTVYRLMVRYSPFGAQRSWMRL